MSAEPTGLLVLATTLDERGGWLGRFAEWIGLGGERTLRVTVANIGTERLDGFTVDAGRLGTTLTGGALAPGEQRTLAAPVWLPMDAFGHDASPIHVSGGGSTIEFSATTSTWPWVLIVLATIVLAAGVVWCVSRLRSARPGRLRLAVQTLAVGAFVLAAAVGAVTVVGDRHADASARAAQRDLLDAATGVDRSTDPDDPAVLLPGTATITYGDRRSGGPANGGSTPAEVALGEPLGVLRIPAFGDDFRYVAIEGVRDRDLARGPGHYPGTAFAGQLGNFVLSAHRTSHSAPFADLDELVAGDEVRFDVDGGTFMYRVTSTAVVPPSALDVLLPVPGRPGETATTSVLTLVTCHPEHSTRERLVVVAELLGFVAE